MPSDKHNSITAKAMGLIFILFNVNSFGDMPFRQPKQLQHLHHAWFLPKLTFVLHSFLHSCVGNDSRYGFGVQDLNKHGHFLHYSLLVFEELEVKQSIVIHHDQLTHPLLFGVRFNDQTFHIFFNGWINCRNAFHAVLCL